MTINNLDTRPIRLPPYDPEILAVEDTQHRPIPSSIDELLELRKEELQRDDKIYNDPEIHIQDINVSGLDCEIPAVVLTRTGSAASKTRPGILFLHGGGRVMGNVYVGLAAVSELVKDLDAVIISPGYRLSPDVHGKVSVEDCYASLVWMSQHLTTYNIDPARFMIAGVSAGAGIAAGVALLARDRKGPRLCAQLLSCPMLDDRFDNLSSRQFENGRGFYTPWGRYAWKLILGDDVEQGTVSHYVAPGRAQDLSDLPPAYIDAGSGEPFRDEDIAYATKLWECGVQADLHVWGGGCHGFDLFYPTEIGAEAVKTRYAWLRRTLRERKEMTVSPVVSRSVTPSSTTSPVTYAQVPGPLGDMFQTFGSSHVAKIPLSGTLVVTSGQPGFDRHGQVVTESLEKEFEACLDCVEAALKAGGVEAGLASAHKFSAYFLDIRQESLMQEIWRKRFPEHRPAWVSVGVSQLAVPGMHIEISAEAVLSE
ncbi:hypothetical protein NW762_006145 [Fusarium torreyae]|uniref:Alpha/beta hydrolase fold-3 domain-containing protein n=1 Tax=Fusarium torreyae TaxID=1237075 RepID=A0A9W8S3E3_9HYPO|nr:hypothetical protein NW762_006145 [Fusarium torreyae]